MTKIIAILVAVAAVAAGAYLLWPERSAAPEPANESPAQGGRGMSVEDYVRANISALSPQKEVLGGTFYVTEISVGEDGVGEVHYEDGHIALVADFTWEREQEHGALTITSFVVRE